MQCQARKSDLRLIKGPKHAAFFLIGHYFQVTHGFSGVVQGIGQDMQQTLVEAFDFGFGKQIDEIVVIDLTLIDVFSMIQMNI
ncbi:hypothetical protein PICSAR253_04571 [Mycobacterium avium subsp. paratuberculosis]|nr:hypothetical protein PICSAR253_04571 [Mycobacterium avium subsp. paratuberculosis]